MANEIVGLKIQVDSGEATKSVGSLKAQLREAQADVTKLSEKFGATSKEAVEAAKRAADLRDRIGDARALTDAFNPDAKFRAFTATLSGVAGGFAAVQGALGLVGVESDKVEKTLLKVQSAMAISQGLQTLGESIDSFKQLSAVIQSTTIFQKAYNIATIAAAAIQRAFGVAVTGTSLAFRALRGAILATGIGALVIGIGVLVDKIIDWTNRTSEAEKAQNKLSASTKLLNQDIDNQISVLTALGGKEEEIYKLRLQRNENKEVLDIQEANRIKKQQEEETKKRQEENKKVVEDRKERNQEIQQADADLFKKTQQLSDEIFLSEIEDEKMREEIRVAIQYEREKAEIERSIATEETKEEALKILRQKYDNDRKLLADQRSAAEVDALTNKLFAEVQAEQEAADLKIKNSFDELDAITNNLLAEVDAEAKAAEAKKQIAEAESQFKKQQLMEVGAAVQNLTTIVGRDTVAGKALGIATALINTYQGASEAIKQKSTLPSPFDVIAKVANVGAIIATGLRTVKAITSVQVPGVGGGASPATPNVQVAAPITPAPSPQVASTLLNAQAIQQLGSATNRAYVLETDVTNSQERIRRINRAARLG